MNENNLDVEIKILRSWKKLSGGYDAIAKKVNYEIANFGATGTFSELAKIDTKLGLPRGTSWEMSGIADWYAFEED